MKRKLMWLMVVGCAGAMMAEAEEATPTGGFPKEGARTEMRERGRLIMESREHGEAMIMKMLTADSPIAKELGLTKEQTEALKGLLKGSAEEMKGLQSKMEQAGKRQVELMTQSVLDEDAVMKGVEEIGALRTQIAKSTTKRILAAQKVLTVEQRTKLREMIEKRMTSMHERRQEGKGPGAPGKRPMAPAAPPPEKAPVPAPVPQPGPVD